MYAPNRRGLETVRRSLIVAFMLVHLSAIVWWLIPSKGYAARRRAAPLAPWLTGAEEKLFAWKSRTRRDALGRGLAAYVRATGSAQSWWMFGPAPIQKSEWLTVRAVIGWKEGTSSRENKLLWDDPREPVYDPRPLYTSYEGELEDGLKRPVGAYSHDRKLVESLIRDDTGRALRAFAEYWGRRYREDGHRLVAVHVLLTEVYMPRVPPGPAPRSTTPNTRVISHVRYERS